MKKIIDFIPQIIRVVVALIIVIFSFLILKINSIYLTYTVCLIFILLVLGYKTYTLHKKNSFNKIYSKIYMDKILKITGIIAILLVALSIGYSLVYKPYHKENAKKYCHRWANDEVQRDSRYNKKGIYEEKFIRCMNEQGQ